MHVIPPAKTGGGDIAWKILANFVRPSCRLLAKDEYCNKLHCIIFFQIVGVLGHREL